MTALRPPETGGKGRLRPEKTRTGGGPAFGGAAAVLWLGLLAAPPPASAMPVLETSAPAGRNVLAERPRSTGSETLPVPDPRRPRPKWSPPRRELFVQGRSEPISYSSRRGVARPGSTT